ncbi:MAG: RNA polymerase sigma factor [Bacteroidetes bacterium]|nr:MAG: RNA polymerase sigma factor [Bacteroidota bacterium]TNE98448.1 MAG: RNA polymerase sigma factor [Bacteroidota bacterium]
MSQKRQKEFLSLYEPVHDRFERFCRARAFGDMDHRDLMNETLLVAYKKFDELEKRASFIGFLFGIASRIVGNHLQKRKTERLDNAHFDLSDTAQPDLSVDIQHLFEALAQLPDAQKEAVILFEISGFSIKEIMEIQEAGESAVKQRLKRGRERLEEILKYESALKI